MRPKIVSQPLNSIPLSELLAACMTFRQVMGITTELSTTLSFIRMKSAARLTASISTSAWRQDRKSTRLNSSHLGISYAVFCLKTQIEGHELARATVLHKVGQ